MFRYMSFDSNSVKALAAILLLVFTIGIFSGHTELKHWDNSSETITKISDKNTGSSKKNHNSDDCAIHCFENKFSQVTQNYVTQSFVIWQVLVPESDSALFSLANYRLERPPRA